MVRRPRDVQAEIEDSGHVEGVEGLAEHEGSSNGKFPDVKAGQAICK